MDFIKDHLNGALAVLVTSVLVAAGWGLVFAGDNRYMLQSATDRKEVNRLREEIDDLEYELKIDPNNERARYKLESKERSLETYERD